MNKFKQWLGYGLTPPEPEQPVEPPVYRPLPGASLEFSARVLADAVTEKFNEALAVILEAEITEIATNMVQEYLYESEEGKEQLRAMKSIVDRYPAIQDADLAEALSKAVMETFMKASKK